MKQFITPIIKASWNNQVRSFFSINSYKNWIEQETNSSKWKIKYYKGLGTSTNEEAKEYFSDFNNHKINFIKGDQTDLEFIKLLFDAKMANQRKEWLNTYDPNNYIDYNIKELSYKDFINKDLINFSIYDC